MTRMHAGHVLSGVTNVVRLLDRITDFELEACACVFFPIIADIRTVNGRFEFSLCQNDQMKCNTKISLTLAATRTESLPLAAIVRRSDVQVRMQR